MFVGSGGTSYNLWGFLLTADAIWGSGYRRGFANSGELPPILQFNAAVVRSFRMPGVGNVEGRISLINVFDHTYQIRNGSGIGVFSPSYGPRRTLYAGIKFRWRRCSTDRRNSYVLRASCAPNHSLRSKLAGTL